MIAVVHESSQILEQRNFLANPLKFCRPDLTGLANDIGCGFGLSASAVVDEVGL